jgi:hypothetical protein
VSDAAILDRLPEFLPPGARPSPAAFVDMLYSIVVGGEGPVRGMRRYHVLYGDGTRMLRTHDLDQALAALAASARQYVAVWAPRRVFVRAEVVAWHGRAILFPGAGVRGGSRLVRALVSAGAEPCSDDFAVLDARGRVHGFRSASGQGVLPAPGAHAPGAGEDPRRRALPVALVVLPGGRRGRPFRPRVLGRGRAVLELLSHTVPARRSPDRALEALSQVVAGAPVVEGVADEADDARSILDWLGRPPRGPAASGLVPELLATGG